MDGIVLTRLSLTPQGMRVPIREWHTVIATSSKNTSGDRALWAWPDRATILVQSPAPGMLTDMLTGLATVTASGPRRTAFPAGTRVRVSGLLNPTKTKWVYNDERVRVKMARGLVPESEWPEWVAARLDGALSGLDVTCQRLPTVRAVKPGHVITMARMAFSGTATVDDPVVLGRLIRAGIGKEKAYGCGLILVDGVTP
ncbi:hypothetical protein FB473_003199 [Brooklawnia cerclae]|uniref:Type I-E CRISPR-associated protein Cas6/Cse3/CasE n=2 Tax=Brooklawnia cerclae TaxID=349934 RepID=A0ABX0SJC2_9ACTN|nr:hypothetical protein [Brooklawnia cerclae]